MKNRVTYLLAKLTTLDEVKVAEKLSYTTPDISVGDYVYCIWEADGTTFSLNFIGDSKFVTASGPSREVSFQEILMHIYAPKEETYRVGEKYKGYYIVQIGKNEIGLLNVDRISNTTTPSNIKEIKESELDALLLSKN